MREVVTLQFGEASNRLAENLWQSALRENEDGRVEEDQREELDAMLIYKRRGCHPRAVAFGCKGDFNKTSSAQNRSSECNLWEGNVQIVAQDSDDAMRTTSVLSARSMIEVNEFRSFDPLNNYYEGLLGSDGKIRRETVENACDAVRIALEECDRMQGIQCIVDIDSAWGGFASEVMRYVEEECPSTITCCFGLDERYPLKSQTGVFDKSKQDGRRAINLVSSVLSLNEQCSMFIPFSPKTPADGAIAWDCMSSVYRWSGEKTLRDMSFHSSMKVMELSCISLPSDDFFYKSPVDRIGLWDSNSHFPTFDAPQDHERKFHFQFLTRRGNFNHELPPHACDPFQYWSSSTVTKSLYSPDELLRIDQAIASLSITDSVAQYLKMLATKVAEVDRRVVHEYTQSGMSVDATRDMHSELLGLSEAVM
ncbi:hypothetical protein AC1031_003292 [Aphanomyces cochlioides]|nr:hypothetical protein AC1031_003292 [Aphanomyces cochlioides]